LPKVVVVQPEDSSVDAEPEFVCAMAPSKVVVDEEAGGFATLNPSIV